MKKISSIFIAMLLMFQCIPSISAFAENSVVNETIRVIAASDFQSPTGISTGKAAMEDILSAMEQDNITQADGFLFCGDYDYSTVGNSAATMAGVQAVKEVVSEIVPQENIVLAQGNHDTMSGISASGKNDPTSGDYGVFVINEDDYMWFNDDEDRIKNTAQNLIDYLNGKLAIAYDKPIFIVSHLPLHYTRRTEQDGDGQHANYIFDVLNEAGAKGLNLFFLFGHNHSNGWDDHLGGSAIYLAKGDEILIAQNSQAESDCKTETLNFSYLNAGYVGYYGDNIDTLLTMTVFEITGDKVSIRRYNKDGIQLLKKRGVNSYRNVYYSPQEVTLMDTPTESVFMEDIISVQSSENRYTCINSLNELVSGENYLLLYKSNFMLPSVVKKTNSSGVARIGFDVEAVSGLGGDVIYGLYKEKEWTFTAKENGWLIGDGEKYAKITATSEFSVTATLEEVGDVFEITSDSGRFYFSNGNYVLNYNSRGVINGYASDPAPISIYKSSSDYSILIANGIATKEDVSIDFATLGDVVKITAEKAQDGMVFDKWIVEEGDVILADINEYSTTFTMNASEVKIKATYKPIESSKNGCNGSVNAIFPAIILLGAVLCFINKRKESSK